MPTKQVWPCWKLKYIGHKISHLVLVTSFATRICVVVTQKFSHSYSRGTIYSCSLPAGGVWDVFASLFKHQLVRTMKKSLEGCPMLPLSAAGVGVLSRVSAELRYSTLFCVFLSEKGAHVTGPYPTFSVYPSLVGPYENSLLIGGAEKCHSLQQPC